MITATIRSQRDSKGWSEKEGLGPRARANFPLRLSAEGGDVMFERMGT